MDPAHRGGVPTSLGGPYSVWIVAAGTGRGVPPPRSDWCYRLVLVVAGEDRLLLHGRHHVVAAGGSWLAVPGDELLVDATPATERAWVCFEVAWTPARRAGAPILDADPAPAAEQPGPAEVWACDLPLVMPQAVLACYRQALPRIVERLRQPDPIARMQGNNDLDGMLIELVAHCAAHTALEAMTPAQRIVRAEATARTQLDTSFGVDDFAAAAGWSRSRFCAIYQELRGESPGAFLRRERLARARALLVDTALPITEIAKRCGYADHSVFARLFRREAGASPTEFRQRRR